MHRSFWPILVSALMVVNGCCDKKDIVTNDRVLPERGKFVLGRNYPGKDPGEGLCRMQDQYWQGHSGGNI